MSGRSGLYSRGAGNRKRQKPPPANWFYPGMKERLPPKPEKVPEGCVDVQPWGPLPAKPPGRAT